MLSWEALVYNQWDFCQSSFSPRVLGGIASLSGVTASIPHPGQRRGYAKCLKEVVFALVWRLNSPLKPLGGPSGSPGKYVGSAAWKISFGFCFQGFSLQVSHLLPLSPPWKLLVGGSVMHPRCIILEFAGWVIQDAGKNAPGSIWKAAQIFLWALFLRSL